MFRLYRKAIQLLVAAITLGLFLSVIVANSIAMASPATSHSFSIAKYQFKPLNDNADPTFNQLLGINDRGLIAGYFGSGTVVNGTLHPTKGDTLSQPYNQGNYTNENFPGSVQTQVTAINNTGETAGFWVDSAGNNFGFIKWHGKFTSYKDPQMGLSNGVQINQLLGLNDNGIAVGFYTDGNGNNHSYKLDQEKGKFIEIPNTNIPGAVSVMATGINDNNDVVGTYTDTAGIMHGFLLKGNKVNELSYTGVANVTNTTFLGVNSYDQIVGTYTVAGGQMHGFLLSNPQHNTQWQTIDAPNGIGTTTINGLNDHDDLVGFYVDANGNTDGLLVRRS